VTGRAPHQEIGRKGLRIGRAGVLDLSNLLDQESERCVDQRLVQPGTADPQWQKDVADFAGRPAA
jgi:hypothetical protein